MVRPLRRDRARPRRGGAPTPCASDRAARGRDGPRWRSCPSRSAPGSSALAADVLPEVPPAAAAAARVAAFAPPGGRGSAAARSPRPSAGRRLPRAGRGPGHARLRRPGRRYGDPAGGGPGRGGRRWPGWCGPTAGRTLVAAARTARLRAPARGRRDASAPRERLAAPAGPRPRSLKDAAAGTASRSRSSRPRTPTLRRKLGEARAARPRRPGGRGERGRERRRARRSPRPPPRAAAQDAELRRLRARVEQLEAEPRPPQRRPARSERDEATMRARLLLDTVLDAAAGLRRELALPGGRRAPRPTGWRRTLAEHGSARPRPARASLPVDDPALLEQLLALPRARLLVDGYNVSKTAWPSSRWRRSGSGCSRGLAPLVARTGAETTVVFDAAELDGAAGGRRAARGAGALQPAGRDRRRRDPRPGGRRAAGPPLVVVSERPGGGPRRPARRGPGRGGAGA